MTQILFDFFMHLAAMAAILIGFVTVRRRRRRQRN
ncbi:PEP-CTERM protein-sorting domain-containing protein [Sphingobium sp. YR768]|nr:PEP-CTERM protein-sorting domain-containing protein [Sphingobium sp. YR768]